MALVPSSGGSTVEKLSLLSLRTMAAIFSGGTGMNGRPTRLSVATTGMGMRVGRLAGMKMSCSPSSTSGCDRLISTMTLSARMAKLAELPTEVVGMMPPSAVIATASTMAISTP
ncbi:hypothetical protein D3C86_1437660 [compost metagenome]